MLRMPKPIVLAFAVLSLSVFPVGCSSRVQDLGKTENSKQPAAYAGGDKADEQVKLGLTLMEKGDGNGAPGSFSQAN